ncbi:MAG: hypothetical protein RL550_202 [Actinomycetota bacterium]
MSTDVRRVSPDYQPYVAGAFRWRLALRPLDLTDWIQIGDDYDHEMDAKNRVLRDHHSTVFAAIPGVEPESAEVLTTLVDHLVTQFPSWFRRDECTVTNLHRGETFAMTPDEDGRWSEHPLSVAGRLVQEDLALLVERDDRSIFGGGSVCFPNRWDLSSKLGASMAEVHAPVARLNEQLEGPIDDFFRRLTPDKPFWRLGWGVLDTDDPYQPVDGTAAESPEIPAVGDPDTGDRLFLRVERETLRRFPITGAVLFTIRTYIRPLSHLVARPDDAARLADALVAMPDDVADYKRIVELSDSARHWLTSITSSHVLGGSSGVSETTRRKEIPS